ncbi:MAG TPA: hypothetical protein VMS08_01100 [Candidatus Saccharimonadia bacterium]|nr:hypothetical protein [Candidatus Saccharimonadia bacterium]
MSGVTSTAIRCIEETYSTTASGSSPITFFSAASATVSASSTLLNGSTGTWTPTVTASTIKYTNPTNATAPTTTTGATFIAQNITNGSASNVGYWLQFQTFSDAACSAPIDNTTVGFIYNTGSTMSLTVNQTLSFLVNPVAASQSCDGTTTTAASTATTIPFGTVTSAADAVVCQALTAATNATNGFTVYARYVSKPTNAINQTIADTTGTNAAPAAFPAAGTEAYGYTTNDPALGTGTANRFTNPSQLWAAMTTSNAEVMYEPTGINTTTFDIAHQVGVSNITRPGTYTTTIIYTCTPIY